MTKLVRVLEEKAEPVLEHELRDHRKSQNCNYTLKAVGKIIKESRLENL